ncbi:Ankyrin repeat and SOCS box protein 3 [Maublancomyces gigas]|uniref:Ankyrin repeat and SOCS box protein 3 n=1 Tax=Discina gigas TaxID=1032678 RepID=A0ABR3GP94_9PEZI
MSLTTLPNEILFLITDFLTVPDIHSLLLTGRVLSLALPQVIYRLVAVDPKYVLAALFHAAVRRNDSLITTILSRGQNIAVMKDHHRFMFPYHTAPAPCSDGTLKYVLAQGANIVLQQGLGTCQWHALHWAAWRRDVRFVCLLLEKGADIDMKDTSGRTVLHDTVWRRDALLVKLLLKHNADVKMRDMYGRTAVDLASAYGYREIVQMILEMRPNFFRGGGPGDNITPMLLFSAGQGDEEMVRLLVEGGAYLGIKDASGRTPLHLAVEAGHNSVVRTLIGHSVLLSPRDNPSHMTPLHLTSSEGKGDVAYRGRRGPYAHE